MKRAGILMIALALTAGCDSNKETPTGPSNTGPVVFTSQLSAANEVPPVSNAESGGRGTVTITFNVPRDTAGVIIGGGTATFALQLSGLPANTPAIAAHIHPGAAGTNGGVLVNTGLSPAAPILLNDGTGNISLTATISQTDATSVMANPAGFYFNVHSPLNPGGVVRGQLTRSQ